MLTDHKPLLGLLSEENAIPPMAVGRIQRLAITISVNINSVPKIVMPNVFSRYPLQNTNQESSQLTNQVLLTELSRYSPVTSKQISFLSQRDPVLSKVIGYVLTGWPNSTSEQLKSYHYRRNKLSIENSSLLLYIKICRLTCWESYMISNQELTV